MREASISVSVDSGNATIVASGELTLHNTEKLKESLGEASDGSGNIVVDLRGAVFIDSAVLQYLASAAVRTKPSGRSLKVLVAGGSQPEYTLLISGFQNLLEIAVEPRA